MDTRNSKNPEMMYQMIYDGLFRFNSVFPELSSIIKRIVVESNGRYDADNLALTIKFLSVLKGNTEELGELEFEAEKPLKLGIHKGTHKSKSYIQHTASKLWTKKLRIHEKCCTGNSDLKIESMFNNANLQMKRYLWHDVDVDSKRIYKTKKSTGGQYNDDLAITILMIVYFAFVYTARANHQNTISYNESKEVFNIQSFLNKN